MKPCLHNGAEAHSCEILFLQLWASWLEQNVGADGMDFGQEYRVSVGVLWQLYRCIPCVSRCLVAAIQMYTVCQ